EGVEIVQTDQDENDEKDVNRPADTGRDGFAHAHLPEHGEQEPNEIGERLPEPGEDAHGGVPQFLASQSTRTKVAVGIRMAAAPTRARAMRRSRSRPRRGVEYVSGCISCGPGHACS